MIVAQINSMTLYVEARLNAWGREFSLDRETEPHGITILWLLMTYGGEIPRREGGFKPEMVNEQAYQIEMIVAEMHKVQPVYASVLRAAYCSRGREKFERRSMAEMLAGMRIPERAYFEAKKAAVAWVTGALT